MGEKKIMLGNEAIARGAWEAGVKVSAAYPGTPSTEISENIVKYKEIYAEWAPNEKVATEVAIGAPLQSAAPDLLIYQTSEIFLLIYFMTSHCFCFSPGNRHSAKNHAGQPAKIFFDTDLQEASVFHKFRHSFPLVTADLIDQPSSRL